MKRAWPVALALAASAFATRPAAARPDLRGADTQLRPHGDPAHPSQPTETQAGTVRPATGSPDTRPAAVLDIPYVPQSEALCGGAAAAMVLRYWGARDVVAEDFSSLVERDKSGIRVDRLAADIRARGWNAVALTGTADLAREQLSRARPVIALISVGKNRYHYVVVAAWTDTGVLAHDPARAPDRVYRPGEFENAWAKARHWMLVITPGSAAPQRPGLQPAAASTVPADGVLSDASHAISEKILHGSAADAVPLAAEAVRHDPGDSHAWYLLGAAEFLNHHTPEALAAWNHVGEPRLDLIRVDGLDQSSYESVAGVIGLSHGDVITPDAFGRAKRRVADLPAIGGARVDLEPRGQGIAQIDVGVVERSTWPRSRSELAIAGARAAIDREIAETFANVNGSGDAWSASWRWWNNRPRVAFGMAAPGLLGTRAVWQVEGSWEAQSYSTAAAVAREERTRAAVSARDWLSPHWRWRIGSGLDRWSAHGSFGFVDAGLTRRSTGDRFSLDLNAAAWLGGQGFANAGVETTWTSSIVPQGWRYLFSGGSSFASSDAPLDLWQGAGVGHARPALLRAHPLLDDGVITGPAFGRSLQHATASIERWPQLMRLWGIGVAGFVDAAAVQHRLAASGTSAWLADAGIGVRVRAAWLPGILRVDYAHGLRDGASAVSVGWQVKGR